MALNYLIIDDEPIVHTLIRQFADTLGSLHFVGSAFRAKDAQVLMDAQKVDLIFLDVQMPAQSGFEFLQSLVDPPHVIVISAHKDYALESYEYAITDYLLKPFNLQRFSHAIEKVEKDMAKKAALLQAQSGGSSSLAKHIFIKDDKKQHQVALDALIYIKANGNFTSVYHADGHILSQMKISDFEKILPKDKFSRVHRSYIIAHHAISLISANEIELGSTFIPVGRVYKEHVSRILKLDKNAN